jgi:hypothetical protein
MDMGYLKSCGVSAGSYKKIFTLPRAEYPKRVKELVQLMSQRTTDGRSRNLREWKTFAAIDIAYDTPFQQTTPTMINHIMSQNLGTAEALEAVKNWGLRDDDLYLKVPQPDGSITLVPNPPVFFQIFIPIVKAYCTIREAKIYNERNNADLFRYDPLKGTSRNQVLCEIISDLIQTISGWYGYPAVLRQAIHQMLKYGVMLAFPEEEWHCEEQIRHDDFGLGADKYTVKEGIRYIIPHPTRMFYDLRRPLTRINSDTGCEWMGTWYIRSYGDILDNRSYWNRQRIFCGTNWLDTNVSGTYFKEFYPCSMNFPITTSAGPPQREDIAAWYNSGSRDQAVFLTEFFMKLVPADWGLGEYQGTKMVKTYKHPVWHRFSLAGDDTVVWAGPCAYPPCWFMGYDYDENAGRNSSMALECIPWQDHVGNILSQIILTAKQNLANVTFYDSQIVDQKDIDKLKNQGEMKYRGMNFVAFDSLLNQRAGLSVKDAFVGVQLSKTGIQELLQMLPTVLNIMERVLQISAQEAGAAASHQQSKAEVVQTGGASMNRVIFTSSSVDEGIDAWKRQLYNAAMAYLDPEVSAEVSSDIPELPKHIADLGFEVQGEGDGTLLVKGHKKTLRLEGFASSERADNPNKEKETAQIIFQVVGTIAAQPELTQQIGATNLLTLIEQAAKLAGVPRDFKLRALPAGAPPETVPPMILQAIQQAQQATMQAIEEKIAKPVAQEVASDQQQLEQIQTVLKQLQGIYQIAAQTQDKNAIAAQKAQADTERKQAIAASDAQRKSAESQARLAIEKQASDAKIRIAEDKARGELAIEGARATHGAHLAEKTAAASPAKKE